MIQELALQFTDTQKAIAVPVGVVLGAAITGVVTYAAQRRNSLEAVAIQRETLKAQVRIAAENNLAALQREREERLWQARIGLYREIVPAMTKIQDLLARPAIYFEE